MAEGEEGPMKSILKSGPLRSSVNRVMVSQYRPLTWKEEECNEKRQKGDELMRARDTCTPNTSSEGWRLRRAHSECCPRHSVDAMAISPTVTSAPNSYAAPHSLTQTERKEREREKAKRKKGASGAVEDEEDRRVT